MNKDTIFLQAYAHLNSSQKEAVDTIEGPVLVVAGPGTGKTRVLTMRIGQILRKSQVNPYNILALTFTESAATTMKRRLIELIGPTGYYVRICTFHGFCNDLIQEFSDKFAFAKNLVMLDDLHRIKFIQKAIDEVKPELLTRFNAPYHYQREILSNISKLKQENIRTEDLERVIQEEQDAFEAVEDKINPKTGKMKKKWEAEETKIRKLTELLAIYRVYANLLSAEGYYDFDDMIMFVVKRMQEDESFLAILRERFMYILVDEYQDTNGAQNAILSLLAIDDSPNIFAVGDDDQSIYRFQGASVENILYFSKRFRAKQIDLTVNYRSSEEIVSTSEQLIIHNTKRLKGEHALSAARGKQKLLPLYTEFYTAEQEHHYIQEHIQKLHHDGVPYSEIAILGRRHNYSEGIVHLFERNDIPFQLHKTNNILQNIIIEQLITMIRIVENPRNRGLLLRFLFFDFLKIPRLDVYKLSCKDRDATPLFDILDNEEALNTLSIESVPVLKDIKTMIINWMGYKENLSFIQFLEKILHESGLIERVVTCKDIQELNQLKTFFEFARQSNRMNPRLTLQVFLEDLRLFEENDLTLNEQPLILDKEAVNIMTVHRSKGLEFEHVFLLYAADEHWAGFKNRTMIPLPPRIMTTVTEENSEEEERRLFYVAMTRAKKGLYITNSHYYPVNQSVREVVRTRFIEEIDNQLIEKNEVLHTEATALPTLQSLFAPLKEADYTEEEHFFLQNLLEHFSLSVTALSNYMTCPRLFKYQNLLRLPRTVEGERDQDKILYLGTAVHSALEAFFREIQHGTTPDLTFLTAHFKEALNKELISKEVYEDTLAEGEKIVSAYYEHYQNTWNVPIHLEYGFYNVFLGDIPLTGKVDKIERLDEGQKTVKVVDYKTSTPKSQNEIKGLTKNGDGALYRQLVFYKLLGGLDKKFSYTYGTISECELDFVKPNKSGLFKRESFSIPEQDINELIETIKVHMGMIRSLRFEKINDMAICRECPYQKICWGRKL